MKIFLDTACPASVKKAMSTGMIDGVTTNPSLMVQQGQDPREVIQAMCALKVGPVSVEVNATDADGMLKEAEAWACMGSQVVIKVPLTPEGLRVCRHLREQDVPVNVTLCFSAVQAVLAAKAGATYISPFIGRLEDSGASGEEVVSDIVQLYRYYNYNTQVLAASLRNPFQVLQAARAGAHVVTIPPAVFQQLYQHPLTKAGLEIFEKDWQQHQARISS